jgi:hypothetical protein
MAVIGGTMAVMAGEGEAGMGGDGCLGKLWLLRLAADALQLNHATSALIEGLIRCTSHPKHNQFKPLF